MHRRISQIYADDLTHKAQSLPTVTKYVSFSENRVNLFINEKCINSNYPRCTSSAYHSIALHEKHNWNNSTMNSIWWQTYSQLLNKLTENEKRCRRKFIHNMWPTLYREQKYKTYPSSLCKKCRLYNEKEDHILWCRIPTRQHIRNQWRKEIEEYLPKPNTPPAVKHYMCQGFFTWLENGRYSSQPIENQDKANSGESY
jgi:hypothetical protein